MKKYFKFKHVMWSLITMTILVIATVNVHIAMTGQGNSSDVTLQNIEALSESENKLEIGAKVSGDNKSNLKFEIGVTKNRTEFNAGVNFNGLTQQATFSLGIKIKLN